MILNMTIGVKDLGIVCNSIIDFKRGLMMITMIIQVRDLMIPIKGIKKGLDLVQAQDSIIEIAIIQEITLQKDIQTRGMIELKSLRKLVLLLKTDLGVLQDSTIITMIILDQEPIKVIVVHLEMQKNFQIKRKIHMETLSLMREVIMVMKSTISLISQNNIVFSKEILKTIDNSQVFIFS